MAKTAEHRHVARLSLTCVTPSYPADPKGAEFGLQDRYLVIHSGQPQPDGSVQYEINAVVSHHLEIAEVRWRGPLVHGTPVAPFLYLSVRHCSAQPANWIRRLKVPWPPLSWDQIDGLPAPPCFAASISGSGSGAVPLLGNGWTRQEPPLTEP